MKVNTVKTSYPLKKVDFNLNITEGISFYEKVIGSDLCQIIHYKTQDRSIVPRTTIGQLTVKSMYGPLNLAHYRRMSDAHQWDFPEFTGRATLFQGHSTNYDFSHNKA